MKTSTKLKRAPVDTRSAVKKAKDARFQAEPVALVQRPLRYLRGLCSVVVKNKRVITPDESYAMASYAAARGRGDIVHLLARSKLAETAQ